MSPRTSQGGLFCGRLMALCIPLDESFRMMGLLPPSDPWLAPGGRESAPDWQSGALTLSPNVRQDFNPIPDLRPDSESSRRRGSEFAGRFFSFLLGICSREFRVHLEVGTSKNLKKRPKGSEPRWPN